MRPTPAAVSGARAAALAGLVGAAILIVLSLLGWAAPLPALVGALVVALSGTALAWREARRAEQIASPATAADALRTAAFPLPFEAAVEGLPAPFLLIGAREGGGAHLLYTNAAARELLSAARPGVELASAVRDPAVLEAVDESLYGGLTRSVTLAGGGAQDRVWSVWTAPLTPASADRRLAVLLMRDETELRRAERLRADFLANASHELRTPLASLTGFIETLRGHAREDPAARDKFLAIMAAQGRRMGRLIDDLLSLSRIELNEHVPPSGVCDLNAAVMDTLDALSPVAQERSVVIDYEAASSTLVTGDRDQIVQVIQNLVDNAVKYSPTAAAVTVSLCSDVTLDAAQALLAKGAPGEGGGRMSLLTPDRRLGERFALLRVCDRGPGMAREHLPRLAERFYRVEGQKSSARAGTGLGLAIVKHIVNRHRGGLAVESAPGGGTTFSVYLPLTSAGAARSGATKLS